MKSDGVVQDHSDYSSSESLAAVTPPTRPVTTKPPSSVDQHPSTQDSSREPAGYRVRKSFTIVKA